MCKKDGGIVIPNYAALHAAVFPLSAKNLRGWADIRPPPSVRGLSFATFLAEVCAKKVNETGRLVTFILKLIGPPSSWIHIRP